ncbi:hypothetical protein FACS1894189_1530 [Planctomycetales bacterium]|nr:hypothetical protein FACS1894189_1530 [Planctomycetales bacterium]
MPSGTDSKSDVKKDDKDKDKPKPIKEALPDAKKIDGLFTFYQKKDELYAEIKGGNLNTDYLISTAIAQGSGWYEIGGMTGDDILWQFRKVNDKIQVVRRNIKFKADAGTPEEKAVQVAYSDSILFSLPIFALGEGGGDVINLAPLFKTGSLVGHYFDSSRTIWGDVKGFPNNMEFRVKGTVSGRRSSASPDPSAIGITVHYSISKLPSGGYNVRKADPRIGYFTVEHHNFNQAAEDDHKIRYINRWNLQKADSSAKLSPPKKPIVFWIEKTVPYKYRDAVKQGILEWNKAFEKVGFVNAIEVRQQADSDTWDAEDINYTTFRWITSDVTFAMGPSRVNPLTGEIVDADIIFDASWVDFYREKFDYSIADIGGGTKSKEPFARYIERMKRAGKKDGTENKEDNDASAHQHGTGLNNCQCSYAKEKASQFALLALALAAEDEDNKEDAKNEEEKTDEAKKDDAKDGEKKDETKEDEKKDDKKDTAKKEGTKTEKDKSEKEKARKEKLEQFILDGIKDVVMHEVGHTLGLRHNFQASSWLTLEEINRPDRSKEYGIAGSVMDYLAINLVPKGEFQGDYFMTTLGPYDHLAIEYGYKTDANEKELSKIASRQAEKGNNYAPDEDMWGSATDPRVLARDLGSEPLDFAQTSLKRYNQFLPEILERAVRENGSYRDVARYYLMLLQDRYRSTMGLSSSIGGLYKNRDRKGDPGDRSPVQVVDAKKQREAIKFLSENTFGADAFKIAPEIYNKFGQEKWLTSDYNIAVSTNFNLNEITAEIQCIILEDMIAPWVLDGLADTVFRVKDDEDLLTGDELFDSVTKSVFSELYTIKDGDFTSRKPAIPATRRTLQLHYFEVLSWYATGQLDRGNSFDLTFGQSLARQQLQGLESALQSVLKGNAKLDTGSKAHIQSLQERIKKVLDADLQRRYP